MFHALLKPGPALKVTIYLNDDTGSETGFLHQELLEWLLVRGISGATAVRPYAGFGGHRMLHVADGDSVEGEHLPVLVTFVDTIVMVEAILPELLERVTDGMVETQPTEVLKVARLASQVIV